MAPEVGGSPRHANVIGDLRTSLRPAPPLPQIRSLHYVATPAIALEGFAGEQLEF